MITPELNEKLLIIMPKLEKRWNEIKTLTGLEKDYHLSDKSKQYFRRPLSNYFYDTEKLELNNFVSTYPLPAIFRHYKHISVNIKVDVNVCGDLKGEIILNKEYAFYSV